MGTEKIYSAIFSDDDIKWQSIIYELIRSKKIDPWDIDCLLYTSPSPRDRQKSRMPSSA